MQKETSMSTYYYYVYTLSDQGKVFYVGKGSNNRVSDHEAEARRGCLCRKCQFIGTIWQNGRSVERSIVFSTLIEQEAYDHEARVIADIGLGELINSQPGGGKGEGYHLKGVEYWDITDEMYYRYLGNWVMTKEEREDRLYHWRVQRLGRVEFLVKSRRKYSPDAWFAVEYDRLRNLINPL